MSLEGGGLIDGRAKKGGKVEGVKKRIVKKISL